ncbi:COMM domain-containing protein 1-like [Mytilus californianus]|uniref:COMM domain-containing protein 1-like n=1 Tax=Mytilus californianus TaxID=6549 RepID=UPI002246BD99|nr:COMM domain-containing protein 1-like [Mytilus californianus]
MGDEAKKLLALLNGIARRTYYGEEELSDDFLLSQIYPDMPKEESSGLITKCTGLMKNMVSADMDFNQLDAFLVSQTKRRENPLTEEQTQVFRKFWKNNKNKIHDSIIAKTKWNNSLQNVLWRIDLKAQARNMEQMNESSAIMEFQINSPENKSEVVRFEMDETKLTEVLTQMKEIETEINNYCQ